MNIAAINAASVTGVTAGRPSGRAAFTAAEHVLGMSAREVRSGLDSGSTLADLASQRGIDQDKLVSAMAAAITAEQPGISASRATEIATRMATTTPPAHPTAASGAARGPGGPRGAGGPPPTPPGGGKVDETDETDATGSTDETEAKTLLEKLAALLGVTTEELLSSLEGGQTLGGLATSRGVDPAAVAATVESTLKNSGSRQIARNASAIADALVDGSLEPGSLISAGA